ncbi:MAG: MBL fold metallo-hydrolase [Saprospiraceae bacterium]
MAHVKSFVFNDFSENTYIVYDETNECIIIDPGCCNSSEEKELSQFISDNNLNPTHLINTHCHIDHILGNNYIHHLYQLPLEAHKNEKIVLESGTQIAMMYGISYSESPPISVFLQEGKTVEFGNTILDIIETPGHSPASISLYSRKDGFVISGDVLFQGSIGRTDLPGGNFDILISMITQKLFTMPAETKVYSGHGPVTTIGQEMRTNPFF